MMHTEPGLTIHCSGRGTSGALQLFGDVRGLGGAAPAAELSRSAASLMASIHSGTTSMVQ